MTLVVRSPADGNHRTCPQVVAPLQLDLGRFAEYDDQFSLGDGSSGVLGVGQSGYMYMLCAIVVHDGGMCVASIHTAALACVCQQLVDWSPSYHYLFYSLELWRAVLYWYLRCRKTNRGGGHYMAYVRKRKQPPSLSSDSDGAACRREDDRGEARFTDEWLWFSDLCCGEVSSQEVGAAEPYICFYERA